MKPITIRCVVMADISEVNILFYEDTSMIVLVLYVDRLKTFLFLSKSEAMEKYFIFVKNCGGSWERSDKKMLSEQLRLGWDLGRNTPRRSRIKKGDKIIFYISGHGGMVFVGDAIAAEEPQEIPLDSQNKYFSLPLVSFPEYWLKMMKCKLWKTAMPIKSLVESLSFFKHKRNFGGYLQGGVVEIPKQDFDFIISRSKLKKRK